MKAFKAVKRTEVKYADLNSILEYLSQYEVLARC